MGYGYTWGERGFGAAMMVVAAMVDVKVVRGEDDDDDEMGGVAWNQFIWEIAEINFAFKIIELRPEHL